jgi:hypothetical protein
MKSLIYAPTAAIAGRAAAAIPSQRALVHAQVPVDGGWPGID